MTNTLHALIDRILDVTLAHLPVRTQSGIVNRLPLKAIRLLVGGEAKSRRHVGQRDLRRSVRRAAARRAFWVGPLGRGIRGRARRACRTSTIESSDSGTVAPDPLMKQAADDIESGKRPTDRSEATDAMQRSGVRSSSSHHHFRVPERQVRGGRELGL
jgi:hypothetical protein